MHLNYSEHSVSETESLSQHSLERAVLERCHKSHGSHFYLATIVVLPLHYY